MLQKVILNKIEKNKKSKVVIFFGRGKGTLLMVGAQVTRVAIPAPSNFLHRVLIFLQIKLSVVTGAPNDKIAQKTIKDNCFREPSNSQL